MATPETPQTDGAADLPTETPSTLSPYPVLARVPGGRPNLDAAAEEAAARAASRVPPVPIRLALQPQVFPTGKAEGHWYATWAGVRWVIELPDLATTLAFRQDLDEFIRSWVASKGAPR